MARRPRNELPDDGYFHVISRGVDRGRIVLDDVDTEFLGSQIRLVAVRFDWHEVTYIVMPNHIHIVLEAERIKLSAGVRRLKGVYAQEFNRRHERTGPLFDGRFRCFVIDNEERLANTRRYILDNAHRAGLCEEGDPWPWCGTGLGWSGPLSSQEGLSLDRATPSSTSARAEGLSLGLSGARPMPPARRSRPGTRQPAARR